VRPSTRPHSTAPPCISTVESKLPVPIHVGGGYGGDSDWLHGVWKGDNFTEPTLTYDMADPAIVGRAGFGVIGTMSAAPSAGTVTADRSRGGAYSNTGARPSRPVRLRRLAHRRPLVIWGVITRAERRLSRR